MAPETASYTAVVTDETTAYLDAVTDCLVLLPEALAAYGDTQAFADASAALGQQESTCDDHRQRLCGAIGRARPAFTDLYLRAAELSELFRMVDAVANAAEAFIRDLGAMSPSLADTTRRRLEDIAALACQATTLLTDAVESYVRALAANEPTPPITEAVERIRGLESQCDQYRETIVARAFERDTTANALAVRELAQSLDAIPDAVEDAADQLVFCWTDT